jgi:predicted phage terminase large subunit-like protein
VNGVAPEIDPEIAEEMMMLEAELMRRSLKTFIQGAWHIVEPDVPLKWNWHHDVLCSELEAFARGDEGHDQVIFNVPPGTSKSLFVSVLFPAWVWTRDPGKKFLCASYGSDLSTRDTMRMRDVIRSEWYSMRFSIELRADQEAKTWFANTAGGWRIASSVGGRGTGEHPDFVLIDDPHSAEQAKSEIERQTAKDWIGQTISTRGMTKTVRKAVIMQRLHQEDMTGHLLSQGGWRHVMIPMTYEVRPDAYYKDPRKPGELLWPEVVTPEKLEKLYVALGAYGVSGQLQQRPSPQGGSIFKRSWFKFVDAVPAAVGIRRVRAWDTAATEGGGDYTVGTKLAHNDAEGATYIEHVLRGQWGPAEVEKNIRGTAVADSVYVRIKEQQEPGSAGKAIVVNRATKLQGFDYKFSTMTGDKVDRAQPLRAQAEAGNVYLVRGPWNEAFLDELENFPNGSHDDQVDSASDGYNELVGGPRPVQVKRVLWG